MIYRMSCRITSPAILRTVTVTNMMMVEFHIPFVSSSSAHKVWLKQQKISYSVLKPGCKPELQMMYAGSKNHLVKEGQFTKVRQVSISYSLFYAKTGV